MTQETQEIKGRGASKGVVQGKARIVADVTDSYTVQQGEIAICKMTTPQWTPMFSVIAAIVSEQGGILSHPAIVARERKIPAVVGATEAMAAFKDGDTVEVDGSAGVVRLIERSAQ